MPAMRAALEAIENDSGAWQDGPYFRLRSHLPNRPAYRARRGHKGMISSYIICSLEALSMTDILIRDIPDDVLAAIDARANRAGLSRTEYLRRTLAREKVGTLGDVTVDDLARFSESFADLGDVDAMDDAWS